MLIFTYKLEKYIKNKILPRILLLPNKYIIKGSFRRKVPYVTDIDIVSNVYPTINRTNIYEKIIKLLTDLMKPENSDIIVLYITCGIDERFDLGEDADEKINEIKKLLTDEEQNEVDVIIDKYADNPNKKLFYLNEFVWKFYKLRWTPREVLDGIKKLRGGIEVNFKEIVEQNSVLLLQYFVKIGSYPIGIDTVVIYGDLDLKTVYRKAADYQVKLANYGKEYYFMLFPLKYYFRDDKKISQELDDILEKKFGLYKQLMVRIDTYTMLYGTGNLTIKTAVGIVTSILNDIKKLPGFTSNIADKIREVSMDNPPDKKMADWNTLLDVLYDEINTMVNMESKKYFFKYLEMVPKEERNKFYLSE